MVVGWLWVVVGGCGWLLAGCGWLLVLVYLDVKCFLMEQFGHNIKFSELERKNESQFVFPVATKVENVINLL